MDWGGIIAGAMGGGAQAVGEIADNQIRQRDLEAAGVRAENRAIEGERRRAQLNLEMAGKEADRKMQAYMVSSDKVDVRAKEIRHDNNLDSLTNTQAQIGGDAPAASKEELDALLADPKNRKMYEDAGYIPKATGSGLIMDKINAARDVAADPALRKDLTDEYKTQVGIEREATRQENTQRSLDQKDAAQADRERRTDALFAKISNGQNGKGDTDQWLKLIGEQRKGYKDDLAQLRNDRATAIAAEPNPKKKQEIIARFDAQIASLKVKSDEIDSKIDAVTSRLLDKPGAPEMKSKADKSITQLPAGSKQIGTSGGKPVYETPDGKRFVGK